MPFDQPQDPERGPCAGCGDSGWRTVPIPDEMIAKHLPPGAKIICSHATVFCGCAAGKKLARTVHPTER